MASLVGQSLETSFGLSRFAWGDIRSSGYCPPAQAQKYLGIAERNEPKIRAADLSAEVGGFCFWGNFVSKNQIIKMLFGKLNLISYLADESKTIEFYEKIVPTFIRLLYRICVREI